MVGEVGMAKMAALDEVGEEEILERIAQGETMQMLCKQYNIGTKLWYKWLDRVEGRRDRYNAAQAEAAHFYANRAVQTAQAVTPDMVNVARLQVDTDKWIASKLNAQYDTRQRDVAVNISVTDLHAQAAQLLNTVEMGDVIDVDAEDVSDG
jgi:lysozyme family protein